MPDASDVTDIEDDDLSFADSYKYPADKASFLRALKEAELDNWVIDDSRNPESTPVYPADSDRSISIFAIKDDTNTLLSTINLRNAGRECIISFAYREQKPEDYMRFQKEVWPKFWPLAGMLFESSETVAELGEQCIPYFDNYSGEGEKYATLKWCKTLTAEIDMYNNTKYFFKDLCISKISDINMDQFANNDEESPLAYCGIKGKLKNLRLNDDILDFSSLEHNLPWLPWNADNYQKADLIDETGAIAVYITPTVLTNSQLSEELFHHIIMVKAPEPYCIITFSTSKFDLIKQTD